LKTQEKRFRFLFLGILLLSLMSARYIGDAGYSGPELVNDPSQIAITPTCLDRGDIPDSEYHWLYFPATADEMATQEYYGFLAGQLIRTGVVDASDCPLNGVWPTGYANACGLEKTEEIVFTLQNIYDDEILQVAREIGVPPLMLKQLIRYESQFWPTRFGTYHFGLGHLTLVGASNAIQWNPELYNQLCTIVYNGPCPQSYNQTYLGFDNLLSGQLLNLMDSSCPECEYKFDVEKAENSIYYIGQSLMSYCKQTSQIVYNVTGQHSSFAVDYATIWRLTLLNYNAGPTCVYNALDAAYTPTTEELSWSVIAANITGSVCEIGLDYVNNITSQYYTFTPPQ
jgi:hypothetical protein